MKLMQRKCIFTEVTLAKIDEESMTLTELETVVFPGKIGPRQTTAIAVDYGKNVISMKTKEELLYLPLADFIVAALEYMADDNTNKEEI